jgi:hypothetical protein
MTLPAHTTDAPASRDLFTRMADWFRDCTRRLIEEREWLTLDRPERGRIAHDLGMGTGDMDALMHDSGGSAELDQVLARTGLQHTATVSGAMHDLQRVCGLCHDRGECRDWLAVPAEAHPDAMVPDFCPNRDELGALRTMQQRRTALAGK